MSLQRPKVREGSDNMYSMYLCCLQPLLSVILSSYCISKSMRTLSSSPDLILVFTLAIW